MKYGGALPMQHIHEMIRGEFLVDTKPENVRTGSLDLTPTSQFYRVSGAFLPSSDETVERALKRVGADLLPPGAILERGACYVCRLEERVDHLPGDVYGYANPKSSSGRVDLHVRLLTDRVSRYDSIPNSYRGPLWLLIAPKTFAVAAPEGVPLNQVRFFTQDTRLDKLRLELAFEQNGGLIARDDGSMIRHRDVGHSDEDGSVILTLGLDFRIPGFEAIPTGLTLDLKKPKHYYDPREFFRPVTVSRDSLMLVSNTFYILSTREFVRVPVDYACEMAPMDERSGEIRSHYAGYIDSGWGIGQDGNGRGRPLTLEVRSFDNRLIIRGGQPIAKIRYERVVEVPTEHYDSMSPNYGQQSGPQLSKIFKPWEV